MGGSVHYRAIIAVDFNSQLALSSESTDSPFYTVRRPPRDQFSSISRRWIVPAKSGVWDKVPDGNMLIFLPRDAMLARYVLWLCVCLSVSVTSRCSTKAAKRKMKQTNNTTR